jgi:serine/threonine protein kinase
MSRSAERGLIVGQRYRLESVLGEGGMAVVWNAVHTETDRKVALKLVRADYVRQPAVREMFVREARVAARIGKNEHIVDVLDAGVDDALEVPFIAMELLEGEGLDAHIARGPIATALAADLLDQLGDALDQAHGAGVFHRDLKPQNLFITKDRKGTPLLKVLDFGIAKLSESTASSATNVGTPAYSAPEQLGESWRSVAKGRGKEIAAEVSAMTDVWALGLIAYEMLTGSAPGSFWGAQTLAELPLKIVIEPLPSASARAAPVVLPTGFDTWLARCLQIDATKRYPSAREAIYALVAPMRATNATPARQAPAPAPSAPAAYGGPGWRPPAGPPAPTLPSTPQGPPPPQPRPPGPPPGYIPTPGAQPVPPNLAALASADPRIRAWSVHRRADMRAPGDTRAWQSWPVHFLPRIENVIREARVTLPGAVMTFAEVVSSDGMRKAMGEDRMLVSLVQSQRLAYRAALRSKRAAGFADGVSRGLKALDALITSPTASLLRDPQFETSFEVWAPTPQEAHAAVPIPMRQLLMSGVFHGVIERFPGAILLTSFDAARFDPTDLDRVLDLASRLLAAIP